jgi:Carboxypeptidase regulatory-like domain
MRLAASFFIACLFVSLVVSLSRDAKAQQEAKPKRDGAITGRIIADGRPVAGAQVVVHPAVGKLFDEQRSSSDEDGAFKVTGLSPGAYYLSIRVPGYVASSDSSGDSSGPRMHRIGENVAVTLIKGGVITGRVTDEFGEPIVGARVMAYRVRTLEGRPDLDSNVMDDSGAGRETDDRGVYRIFGLEPRIYVVSLNGLPFSASGLAQPRNEPPVYHPSSTRNAAAEITVISGGETNGVDIRHRAMRGHSINGAVTGATEGGGVLNAVAVTLLRAADRQPVAAATMLAGEKNFSLRGVEDGGYDLIALRFTEEMDFSASVPRRMTINGADISGIDVKLLKLGSIEGRVAIEPSKRSDACKREDDFSVEEILLIARRDEKTTSLFAALASLEAPMSVGRTAPGDDGAFVLKNIEPGRIRIETDLPGETWYVRAITQKSSAAPKPGDASQNGIAVKSGEKVSGLELTIAEGAASLKGKVVPANETAKLPKLVRVHLIPAEVTAANDPLRYYEKIANNDGSFELKNLAPGRYLLHLRAAEEGESAASPDRLVAWDANERAKLRREAEAAKNEIELKPCQRAKDHVLRWLMN